jgi:hypothetical protein
MDWTHPDAARARRRAVTTLAVLRERPTAGGGRSWDLCFWNKLRLSGLGVPGGESLSGGSHAQENCCRNRCRCGDRVRTHRGFRAWWFWRRLPWRRFPCWRFWRRWLARRRLGRRLAWRWLARRWLGMARTGFRGIGRRRRFGACGSLCWLGSWLGLGRRGMGRRPVCGLAGGRSGPVGVGAWCQ